MTIGRLRIAPGLISALIGLLVWQLAASFGPLAGSSIPTATATLAELWNLLFEAETWQALWDTIQMALYGLLITIVTAIPIGILIGLSRFAYRSTKFTFDFLKVIPPIVIIPITILVMGPTMQMGVFLVVFGIFFVLVVQTAYGVRDTDPVLLENMRCYGLGTARQIWYARLPGAAPFIALGMRISVTVSLIVAVVAGLVGGAPGLGQSLMLAEANGQSTVTFAIVVILGILGLAASRLVEFAQRRLITWIPS